MREKYVKLNTDSFSLEGIKNNLKEFSVNNIIIRKMLENPERVYKVVGSVSSKSYKLDAFEGLNANNVLRKVLEVVNKSDTLEEVEEL